MKHTIKLFGAFAVTVTLHMTTAHAGNLTVNGNLTVTNSSLNSMLGINTPTPSATLDIRPIAFANNQSGGIQLATTDGHFASGMFLRTDSAGIPRLAFDIDSNELLNINNSGDVGIGTTYPTGGALDVETAGTKIGVYSALSTNNALTVGAAAVKGIYTPNGTYGELGVAQNSPGDEFPVDYGVYGYSASGYAGYFDGQVNVNGNFVADNGQFEGTLHVNGNFAPGAEIPANTTLLASGSDGFDNRIMSVVGDTAVYVAMNTSSPTNYGELSTYDYKNNVGLPLILNANGGRVGIHTFNPDNLLTVNGSADKPGGGSWGTFSDARLKDIGQNFNRGLADLDQVQPVHYRYKSNNPLDLPSDTEYIGVVAQQVQNSIPEAVERNKDGYLKVNNDPIIWTMLNAIKDLKAENDALKERLDRLEMKKVPVTK